MLYIYCEKAWTHTVYKSSLGPPLTESTEEPQSEYPEAEEGYTAEGGEETESYPEAGGEGAESYPEAEGGEGAGSYPAEHCELYLSISLFCNVKN